VGRILALDHGTVRIGVAVTDAAGISAHPQGFLAAAEPSLMASITELVAELGVDRILVGLPTGLRGSEGPAASAARAFAGEVAEATGVSVELVDERFTTAIAERALIETGTRRKRRRQVRDGAAAAVLLQGYLERE
jgi:putative Holliday junction resolvase